MSDKETKPTVLIVDDTPTNLGVVVEFLEENGFRVVVAQDGKEGVQRALFIKPDLILMDVMMPGVDGFEATRQLKGIFATRDIPVIFMTALADTASKLEGFKAGGVDYVTKPLAMEELLARVATHIALRATQQRLDQQNQRLQQEASVRQIAESTLQEAHEELKSVYKRLETAKIQLLHATKMASIGLLAGSAAQQIKSPIVSLNEHLLQMETCIARQLQLINALDSSNGASAMNEPAAALLQNERSALQLVRESQTDLAHLERLARTFSDISHIGEAAWQSGSLADMLDNTVALLSSEFEARIVVNKNYAELPPVEFRPADLMQVVMNLLLNAAQAIPGQGNITIATGVANQEVWIDVGDDGVGIAHDHLNRIFDPFFSARPGGKGAGLGLSLAFAAVKKHHGRIEVKSTEHVGSNFRIWLPVRQPLHAAA
ncbi:MAG TPA: response regulator [Burkholderiaceae bacterium]|jgi:signal transduction histidine kinase